MMQYCFPTIYWHFHVGQFDFGDLENKCVPTTEWNCQVKTSRGIEHDWTKFVETIEPYLAQLPYKELASLKLDDPWMNVYEKGSYQEAHQHISSGEQLSYCYFSKLPEDSGRFCFWNETFRQYCSTGLVQTLKLNDHNIVEWGFPEIKEGDLIIFPSFLIHQVTYHKADERRVTVSGNIRLF